MIVHRLEQEATFEATTHTEKLGVIDGKPEEPSLLDGHGLDLRKKAGTTQNQPTGIDATQSARFVTRTYLAHFDPTSESTRQQPD